MAAPSLRQYTTTWGVDNGASTAFATLDDEPVVGNVVVAVLSCRNAGSAGAAIAGFTKIGPLVEYGVDCVSAFYRPVEAGDSATVTATGTTNGDRNFWVGEIQDTSGLDTSAYVEDVQAAIVTATVTPTAGLDHLLIAATAFGNAGTDNHPNATPTDGATQIWEHGVNAEVNHPFTSINHRTITDASGSYSGGAQNHISDPAGSYPWGVYPPPPGTAIVLAFAGIPFAPIGWDVYSINPPGDTITYLATLDDDIFDKTIKIERNNTGSGQFTINRHSALATADILAPGNLVKVCIPAIDDDYIFSFFLETGEFTLVSSDEEGGENITFGGRGGLAYWDNAVWLQESYVIPWWDPAWGTPPAGTIGRLIVAPGTTFWDYTITAGRVASRAKVTSAGGFAAWYDSRKSYRWVSTSPYYPKTAKLVQLSSGGMNNHYLHPMDAGFTEVRATYFTGQRTEFATIGDGTKPGQILERIYQEGVSADRPSHPLPLLTIDFDDTNDSTPEAWASTDALLGITAETGEHYLSTVMKLIETGIIDVEMDPHLGFHAWNSRGRDLTGVAFGAGVVRFVKGVNIAADLHRERTDGPVATFTQVVGNDASAQAELPDAATRVTRETSTRGDTDDATALAALGLADLEGRLVRSDAIGFAIATGDDDATGKYLPGPPGSDHGDFWIGDLVTLHTGTGEQDFNNAAEPVSAITIYEDEAANLEVIVELGSGLGANETALGSGVPGSGSDSLGGGPGGTGGGTFDGSLYQELSERGVADGYATLESDGLVPASELGTGTPDGTLFLRDDGTWQPASGAPTTADYLVGTAQAGLSAEIVVGATPGGELGGTWASPTVDATHSGSAHLALGSTSSTAAAGDHTHAGGSGGIGPLLIEDTPAGSPLVFADLLQNEEGTDLLYADAV